MKNVTALCLGGNIGNREQMLSDAIKMIETRVGKVTISSALYETEAWGFETETYFLNQVILVETVKEAVEVLRIVLEIENELGRERTDAIGYQSRPIDIDILFFNNRIMNHSHLMLPHPRMQNRKFVLLPLNDVAPNWFHPLLKKKVKQILVDCTDNCEVKRLDE